MTLGTIGSAWIRYWGKLISVKMGDDEENRLARLFNILMVISTNAIIVLTIVLLTMGPIHVVNTLVNWYAAIYSVTFIPFSLYCFFLSKHGHVHRAIKLYSWINFFAIGLAVWLFDGIHSPAWLLYIWTITIAGTLLAPAYSLWMTGGVVAYYALLLLLTQIGMYVPPLTFGPSGLSFLHSALLLIMLISTVGLLTFLNMKNLREALTQLRATMQKLTNVNSKLQEEIVERTLAEEHLHESETRYRNVFDHAGDIIFIVSQENFLLSLNPAFEKATGLSVDVWRGKSFVPLVHPDDLMQVHAILKQVVTEQATELCEVRLKKKTEEYLTVECTVAPLQYENTNYALCIARDITERKQMEKILRASEEKYRTVADFTYDWEYWLGPDGNYKYVSPSCERITGYTPQEFLHDSGLFLAITHPTDRSIVIEHLRNVLQPNKNLYSIDFRINTKDGRERWINLTCRPVFSMQGEWLGRRGSNRDITERKRTDQILQKLSQAVEQTADIVSIADREGLIEYVNLAFEKTTGYTSEEVIGKTSRIFKSGEHPASFYERLWKTILDGHPFRSVLINKKKDGTTYFEEKTITPLRSGDGTITHFVSTGKDVTERMKMAELLRQSEENRRLVLSNIHEIVYAIRFTENNVLTGTVDFVNDPVENILGFSAEEFRANPRLWLESLHPDDLDAVRESTKKLLTDKGPITRTYRIKHKHAGEYRWMEDHVVPMLAKGDNKVVGIFGAARDITERRRVQEVLYKSEDRYRDLVEHSHDLICTHDLEGRILSANPWAAKVLGYDIDKMLQMNIRDFLAPELRGKVDTYIAKIQKRGAAKGRLRVQTTTGERRILEYSNTLRIEDVTTPIVRGIARDITERKEAEDVAHAYAERLQLLSKQLIEIQENERRLIARELHDEIGQTLSSLKILLEMSGTSKTDIVQGSLEEALALISSLIESVRNLSLDLRPPALDDLGLVPAIRWHLLNRTKKIGIEVHFKAEPEQLLVPEEIKTVCFRIAQEALTNVLKHSNPKSVEIHIMKRGTNLELTVRDDGTGFDVESAFRQAAAGKSFGLLGMQERARLAGGTLVIRSEHNRGSEVQVTFPNAFTASTIDTERPAE
ncbi:MAG: PAS domain S-box protein [Bacteroidota bacterium]|nr:PAS domain S-box protein [Bacteroidota bacterium]